MALQFGVTVPTFRPLCDLQKTAVRALSYATLGCFIKICSSQHEAASYTAAVSSANLKDDGK